MFSRRSAQALLCFSFLLAASFAFGQTAAEWETRADQAKDKKAFSKVLDDFSASKSKRDWVDTIENSLDNFGLETAKREFVSRLRADAATSAQEPKGAVADANQTAKEILSDPAYRDLGPSESNNWIGNAMAEVFTWILKLISDLLGLLPRPNMNIGMPAFGVGAIASQVFMVVLGIILLAFLGYFAFKISRGRKMRRKAGGLLDDDEPDRTADEWLQQADLLVGQGRYREAVRCLYLACLVRFDDAGVAAFDRGQTNWEHLNRIMASPRKPTGLDFRPPTKSFDNFWYGYAPIVDTDVAEFRALYDQLLHDLGLRKAA